MEDVGSFLQRGCANQTSQGIGVVNGFYPFPIFGGSASLSVAGEATTATSVRAEALDQHDRTWLA